MGAGGMEMGERQRRGREQKGDMRRMLEGKAA